jgi:hypothetical protein
MELIKKDDRWDLYNEDGHKIASTLDGCLNKLSTKNCQAIECGYDLDELAEKACPDVISSAHSAFKAGFQKALELMGDKKFSEEQVLNAFYAGWISKDKLYPEAQESYKGYLKRRITQQTEWDVEIEMEFVEEEQTGTHLVWGRATPKLDADGCLILKLKSE